MQNFPIFMQARTDKFLIPQKGNFEKPQEREFSLFLEQEQHLNLKEEECCVQNRFGVREQTVSKVEKACEQVEGKLEEKVGQEDFSALKSFLEEQGVSKDKIKLLEDKMKKGQLTWQVVFQFFHIHPKIKIPALDQGHKTLILTVLQKIGFSASEAKQTFNLLSSGKINLFIQKVSAKIDKLDPDRKITLTELDLKSFMALLKNKNNSQNELKAFVGELDKDGLKNFFLTFANLIKQQDKTSDDSLDLNDSLKKKLVLKIDELLKNTHKQQSKNKSYIEAQKDDSTVYTLLKDIKSSSQSNVEHITNDKNDKKVDKKENKPVQSHLGIGKKIKHKAKEFSSEPDNSRQEQNKQDVAEQKLEVKKTEPEDKKTFVKSEENINISQSRLDRLEQGAKIFQTAKQKGSAHIWKQVENGVFQNLSKGTSRAILNLDPPDLGKVGLILQVHKNEVNLVLRTSNEDTSQVLNQHLHQLKLHLEQAGFKVQKLEVRTNLENNQQFGFSQGEQQQQHAAQREVFKQRIFLAKNSYFVSPDLARDMLYPEQEENFSDQRVSLFA
ncbi:MAG: flagellar hook-length control protein FliK [Desulfonauticus sp.]|nr:flagellar hook-length control protein FliK [Desulfonauticus sp.]